MFYINYDLFIYLVMFLSGLMVFSSFRKHLLLTLLSLEYLLLILFIVFFVYFSYYSTGYYFIMVFLTFSVCEGALGLSILVSLIRCYGNDNLSSLSLLMW